MRTVLFLGWTVATSAAILGCDNGGTPDATKVQDAGPDTYVVILDGGGPTAEAPDGSAACPAGACNYQTGTGCTGNTACVPALSGGKVEPSCLAAGAGADGAACSDTALCAPGYLCSNPPVCRK